MKTEIHLYCLNRYRLTFNESAKYIVVNLINNEHMLPHRKQEFILL